MNIRITKEEFKLLMVVLNEGSASILSKLNDNKKVPKRYNFKEFTYLFGKLDDMGTEQGITISWQDEYEITNEEKEKMNEVLKKLNIDLDVNKMS